MPFEVTDEELIDIFEKAREEYNTSDLANSIYRECLKELLNRNIDYVELSDGSLDWFKKKEG